MAARRNQAEKSKSIIGAGVAAAILYWIFEAIVDTLILSERTFTAELLNPTTHEIWMRSVGVALILSLGVVAQILMNKRRQAEAETRRLTSILRAIRNVNQLLVRAEDRDSMLQQVCHTLTETRGYHDAWIAIRDTDGGYSHTAQAARGEPFSRLQEKLQTGWLPTCGEKALASDDPVIVEEPPWNCLECPSAEQYAGKSAISCRLQHAGVIHGFICASIPKEYASDEQERSLFKEVADDIAIALYKLELEENHERAEKALRESEEKYRAIVEHSHDGIYIYRGDRFLFVNSRIAEITGYTEAELMEMDIWQLIHPDDRERLREIGRQRAQGAEVPSTYQARVVHRDGTIKHCEFAVTDITYQGGYAALGSVRDITPQKQAEKKLRESEHEKTLILDTSPALIVFQDTDHQVIWANRLAADSVDKTTEELEGQQCYDIWQQGHPCDDCPVEKAIETGETHEAEIATPDGRHWLIRGSPITDDDGHVTGVVETGLDITERKRAEQEMERALEKERVFKLKTAHHFFNPISIARGYMELAMEGRSDAETEAIKKAREALLRVQKVIENIVQRGEIRE